MTYFLKQATAIFTLSLFLLTTPWAQTLESLGLQKSGFYIDSHAQGYFEQTVSECKLYTSGTQADELANCMRWHVAKAEDAAILEASKRRLSVLGETA